MASPRALGRAVSCLRRRRRMRILRWAVTARTSSAKREAVRPESFRRCAALARPAEDGVDSVGVCGCGGCSCGRRRGRRLRGGRLGGLLRGSRHGLRGGLLRRGHIRWSGLQYQPDAQRRLVIFRPGVGVFLGDVGGCAGGGFHQIAADVAGFNPRCPEQHCRRRGEVDAVAGFGALPETTGRNPSPPRPSGRDSGRTGRKRGRNLRFSLLSPRWRKRRPECPTEGLPPGCGSRPGGQDRGKLRSGGVADPEIAVIRQSSGRPARGMTYSVYAQVLLMFPPMSAMLRAG